MVNKLTIAIPIRRRIYTLVNCLKMLLAYSKFQHDIILVLDRPSLKVVDWVEKNRDWLKNHGIKVLKSTFADCKMEDQFGTANASNLAWKNAKTEWLMCLDDDMYCSKDWDYNLLKRVDDKNMVYVPTNVRPQNAVNRVAKWGAWHHLTFPLATPLRPEDSIGFNPGYYALESEWLKWCKSTQVNDVYIERCGERKVCHFLPLVIHKTVFEKSGGFYPSVGRDINFDNKLAKMAYMKTGIRNSFFLHMKGLMVLDSTQPNLKISDYIRNKERISFIDERL